MNIVVFGPQGSGKGTQAVKLSRKLNYKLIEAGEMLRKYADGRPDIAKIMNEGKLLPDDTLFELMTGYIEEGGAYDNLIFDGYPRSKVQFYAIKEWLEGHGTKIDLVVYLKISDEESIARMRKRGREDDTDAAMRERLREYHRVSEGLIEEYARLGILIEVDGEREIEAIFEDIVNNMEQKWEKLK